MHITIYSEGGLGALQQGVSEPRNYPFTGDELTAGVFRPARAWANFAGLDRARLIANVFQCTNVGTIHLLYSTDNGETWDDTGASLTIDHDGFLKGVPADLPAAAKGEVDLCISTSFDSAAFSPLTITVIAD